MFWFLAWPLLWRAGDKTFFLFSCRRRGQSKAAALNTRKRKIREIEELQAMLGRPWWVFFCAEKFFFGRHIRILFSKVTFPTVFFVWCRCLNGCFFRFSVFFCISYTVEHLLTRYKKSRTSEQHNLDSHQKRISQPPFLFSPLNIMVADEEKTIKKQKQAERTA